MIYAKDNLYGLDAKINLIQRMLEKKLSLKWGSLEIYGIIQENIKNGNLIPEVYTENGEYKELFFDDKVPAQICFRVLSRTVNNSSYTASVDVIFNTTLYGIHPNDNRETEKAMLEAYNVLLKCGYVNTISGIKEGISNVYSGFYT